jgi:hypothetical protein
MITLYKPQTVFRLFNDLVSASDVIHHRTTRETIIHTLTLSHGGSWSATYRDACFFTVTDASGRYSSQFFFGNGFWLGSHTLCEELQLRDSNPEPPPFSVAFHVAKLQVALSSRLTPVVSLVTKVCFIVLTLDKLSKISLRLGHSDVDHSVIIRKLLDSVFNIGGNQICYTGDLIGH